MKTYVVATFFLFSACLSAAVIKGKVVDPSGAPVSGAEISIVSRVGVEAQTVSTVSGGFELQAPDVPNLRVAVAAPGFAPKSVPLAEAETIELEIAPRTETVQVAGSTLDVPFNEQGASASVIASQELRERNQPFAFDLLRYLPGLMFNQTGAPGSVSSLFLRGGNSNFTLVTIDGVPVNAFGGAFDFGHIPAEAIDRIEVVSGPQSGVYGPYANSGVIAFETRKPSQPSLEVLAEGGTYHERRFGVSAAGAVAGFGVAASASRYDNDGPVANSDYRNEGLTLNVTRRFVRQSLGLHADFDSNDAGEPGAWGSDPKHTFGGIDLVSRAKNNFGDYGGHYEADLTDRVREELFGSFFLDNSGFRSPFGFSFNRDERAQGEARTIFSATPHYTAAFGVAVGHEEARNTFITDSTFAVTPIPRNDIAVYVENRFVIGHNLFLNAGVRGEWIRTPEIPGDGFSRPIFPANTLATANPKLAAAYVTGRGTRVHASFGTGIRPPSGFELAFTNNPQLKPERTTSVDAGIEQRFGPVLLDATYFYNRFHDLIVTLGGSLATLSHYQSDNLANSRAEGAEFTARVRPSRWVYVTGAYTLLESRILALDGSSGLAPRAFTVGQPLTRRPEHSGSLVATFTRRRLTGDLTGYFRGKALFEEPGLGATNGLFWNPGFANVGLNLNYDLGGGVSAYGSLRNALNRHYEEVFGFPSPRLNFVAGMKWRLGKEK
jgi:outer membrane receptor protein involved in Fe transport